MVVMAVVIKRRVGEDRHMVRVEQMQRRIRAEPFPRPLRRRGLIRVHLVLAGVEIHDDALGRVLRLQVRANAAHIEFSRKASVFLTRFGIEQHRNLLSDGDKP
jgi:hypothetical protein